MEDLQVKDGMDAAFCTFNKRSQVFEYAGAMNPLYLIRPNGTGKENPALDNNISLPAVMAGGRYSLYEIKGDKFPIGNLKIGETRKFTNHSIPLQTGDTLYIFSDGYADQFGGPDGKKFKYQQFKQVLLGSQDMGMEEQGEHLHHLLEQWKGELAQVDDILVIGTRL
jgi:hypothetical protein